MIVLLGALTIPGISKAGVCQDQVCVDKAFTKFEVSVFKANGAYLNSVNKAFALIVAGNESKAQTVYTAAFNKFAASLSKAEAKFEDKTGLDISGATVNATVLEANENSFAFITGQLGIYGY